MELFNSRNQDEIRMILDRMNLSDCDKNVLLAIKLIDEDEQDFKSNPNVRFFPWPTRTLIHNHEGEFVPKKDSIVFIGTFCKGSWGVGIETTESAVKELAMKLQSFKGDRLEVDAALNKFGVQYSPIEFKSFKELGWFDHLDVPDAEEGPLKEGMNHPKIEDVIGFNTMNTEIRRLRAEVVRLENELKIAEYYNLLLKH